MNDQSKEFKILIVDKNARGSFLLSSLLGTQGYEVFTVNSFLKAINYCKQNYSPNLIIVDQHEPCTIFFEFPRKFYERTGKKTPIIAQSIPADAETINKVRKAGYIDYLMRPIEPDILLDRVANIIHPDLGLNNRTFRLNLNEESTMLCSIIVEQINEFGVQALTPFELDAHAALEIQSPTLMKHGIKQLKVSVVECKRDEGKAHPFTVKFSFIGLRNSEFTRLRKLAMFKGEAVNS